ncbi:MAG TPA: LysE family transporter [Polyangiaceae bacterium]|nr:LysE family transporter [Polyangiaceae bacterium]
MNLAFPFGFGIAFVGSMPMSGPVAVLVMARALHRERRAALLLALGGALVETGYAFGIAAFLPQLVGKTRAVVLGSLGLGAVVVLALGTILLVRPTAVSNAAETSPRRGVLRGAVSTLLNPTLIATWTVAVSTLYANGWLSARLNSALAFALGVGLGSLAWFSLAVTVIGTWHRRVTPAHQAAVLRGMGTLLVVSGVVLGVRFVKQLASPAEPSAPPSLERAGRFLSHGAGLK